MKRAYSCQFNQYDTCEIGSPTWRVILNVGIVAIMHEKRITFSEYRNEVAEVLFYKYEDADSGQRNSGKPSTVDNPARLSEWHFICSIYHTPAKREPTRQRNFVVPKSRK
ncbi:hypothetical protein TNCV_376541 [Trichonephila clavipes]|nr:hypothetical protein TNCV_376541 [Trichonephila clavipes]